MDDLNYTDLFVNTLYTMATAEIPENVLTEARLCLLDGIGCMLGGISVMQERLSKYLALQPPCPAGATVFGYRIPQCMVPPSELPKPQGTAGPSNPLIPRDKQVPSDPRIPRDTQVPFGFPSPGEPLRASLQNAALANAMALHAFDMDDGHRFSTVHLAATVIPPVLAISEYYDLSMDDLLRGIVIGYETGIRMGNCIQPAHRARGFHSTGTVGTLAAAMGVAAALTFSKEEMKAALSAAATSAAGLNEMMENISTLKPYNPGRAGMDGITAALIAKAGFVGPYDALSGTFSFFRAMAETVTPDVLDRSKDARWNILGCYHKPYASCRHTHAAIDGALCIARKEHPDPAAIESITVTMYRQGIKGHDYTEIPTPGAGKMSTPFCVALALTKGEAGVRAFSEENVLDPTIKRLTENTRVLPDDAMSALVPKMRPATVTVRMQDGTIYEEHVDYAAGEPEKPLTKEAFITKFHDLAALSGMNLIDADTAANCILTHTGKVHMLVEILSGQFD